MKKYFLLLSFLLMTIGFSQVSQAQLKLPNTFKISECYWCLRTGLYIEDMSGNELYYMTRKFTKVVTTGFKIHDAEGRFAGSANSKVFSMTNTIVVYDDKGKEVGRIKETIGNKIINGAERVMSWYVILNAKGDVVADSTRFQVEDNPSKVINKAKIFRLTEPETERLIAEIKTPNIDVATDKWTVNIYEPGVIDQRILVLIPAFKTAATNDAD